MVPQYKYTLFFAFMFIMIAAGVDAGFRLRVGSQIQNSHYSENLRSNSFQQAPPQRNFANLPITARAAYVYDVAEDQVLYAKNETTPFPLASLTKIMTALVALDQDHAGTALATIQKDDVDQEGDSGLSVGEHFTLSNLSNLTLVGSLNDGAHALAASALRTTSMDRSNLNLHTEDTRQKMFVGLMNAQARHLGLTTLQYRNPTGLDQDADTAGGNGSARDMAYLLAYIIRAHPDLLSATIYSKLSVASVSNEVHTVRNTDDVVARIPGIIASKTGYTDLAGGNLVVVVDVSIGHPVVIVVLGSTEQGRFSDTQTLARAVISAYDGRR